MTFQCHLALALGKTLGEIYFGLVGRLLSSNELGVWLVFYTNNGFPADRITGTTAISGAALCQTWGGKIRPEHLLPKYGKRQRESDPIAFSNWMASLPGAVVEHTPIRAEGT